MLSQRAEGVWDLFSESFSAVVGMGVGMAPSRAVAATMTEACGIEMTAERWMLFSDVERAWVSIVSEKSKPAEE